MASLLVLIAAPGSNAIGQDVLHLLHKFGGAAPRWLATGEACEVGMFPKAQSFIEAITGLPIDTAIVESEHRRKRLLVADMDSTMIEQECIDELGVVAGVGDHIKQVTARAMRGELDFEGALRERVALLKGLPASVVDDLLRNRITFMQGGKTLLATMRANGGYAALVSGGFTAFTGSVSKALGFDEHHANTLLIEGGKLTGKVAEPILGSAAKLENLQRLTKERGLHIAETLAVGDGANDLPMLLAAGLGVALHAKPKVQAEARCRINFGDLTSLLYLQGYTQAEFVN